MAPLVHALAIADSPTLWSPRAAHSTLLHPIFWLHIPKTGSSFTHTVFRFACSAHAEIWRHSGGGVHQPHSTCGGNVSSLQAHLVATNFHTPLPWMPSGAHRLLPDRVVGLFRRPAQRLLSAFYYMRERPSCCHADWGFGVGSARRQQVGLFADAAAFARSPGALGCQAKMVLGMRCHQLPTPAGARIDVARARHFVLREMAFVGLQDAWTDTVCLFHASFGTPLHAVELSNSRPTATAAKHAGWYNESELRGAVDAADEAVYAAALERFRWLSAVLSGPLAECRRSVSHVVGTI